MRYPISPCYIPFNLRDYIGYLIPSFPSNQQKVSREEASQKQLVIPKLNPAVNCLGVGKQDHQQP